MKLVKRVVGLFIVMSLAASTNMANITAYAGELIRPNNIAEAEPNNTQENAQMTIQNNEIAEKYADFDYSGRYIVDGRTKSSDDDWYKVSLTSGDHYLSVVNIVDAVYVELLDSENNVIIPIKYCEKSDVTKFQSNGGIYYIHIVGASEIEGYYGLLIGSPMFSSKEVDVEFTPSTTSGTIRYSFSLAVEKEIPQDAVVREITFRDTPLNSATVTSSSSSNSVTFSNKTYSGEIGSYGLRLKSDWGVVVNPKRSVNSVLMRFLIVYPNYDNTVYPHRPYIKK